MPLFRITTRTKDPAAAPPAAQSPAGPRQATGKLNPQPAAGDGRPALAALAVGTLFGLVLIAGVSVFVVRGGFGDPAPVTSPAGGPPAGPPATHAVSGENSELPSAADAAAYIDASTGPASINPEFDLEEPIAYVNGATIAMRDLDRSVRIARVLADLSGDPVPANDDPAFRDFQVKMLKRIVDLELMAKGVRDAGLLVPGGDTQTAVDEYVKQVGASAEQLAERMAVHNVTPQELDRWFRDARTANFLVTQQITKGKESESRDDLTSAWLKEQWEKQQVVIDFYEPEG